MARAAADTARLIGRAPAWADPRQLTFSRELLKRAGELVSAGVITEDKAAQGIAEAAIAAGLEPQEG